MNNENPHRDGVAAGAAVSIERRVFTTPPQIDQQNHPALHVAPTCELGNTSSYLVAVILYCKEATELAAKILPATPAVFGGQWFYLVNGEIPAGTFTDPVFGETIVEIRDATGEFANVGAPEIEIGELLRAVARFAAFCLARRYCEGVLDGDDESLVQSLDHVANPWVVDRIVLWIDYPPADA